MSSKLHYLQRRTGLGARVVRASPWKRTCKSVAWLVNQADEQNKDHVAVDARAEFDTDHT
jgi:gamma-glutamylcysteine synthetase